jgi:hypothetical protein
MASCDKCTPGTFQELEGQTACEACTPGSYCAEGAAAALPCKDGTYSNATNLSSADDCTTADPGFYAPTGSLEQTPCNPGTVSPTAGLGICLLCQPGQYQPDSGATTCLPCADESLGVYCPNAGTSTPTPCPGGTYSEEIGLYRKIQCTSVEADFYAPTGSKYPEQCPASGFTCPGRAADVVNDPPGSRPIMVSSGGFVTDVEVQTVSFDLDVNVENYNETAVILELAALYGIAPSLISLDATPTNTTRRKLQTNYHMGHILYAPRQPTDASVSFAPALVPRHRHPPSRRGMQDQGSRLTLVVTIIVPDEVEDAAADGDLVDDTESSLTIGGGGGGYSGGGSGLSTAQRFAAKLASLNSADGLSSALGFSVFTVGTAKEGTATQQQDGSCPLGYWCTAGDSVPCVDNTYNDVGGSTSINAGACKPCPPNSQSPQASTSLEDCICNGITDTDPTGYYWDSTFERDYDNTNPDDKSPSTWEVCQLCPVGSVCAKPGARLESLPVKPGYYRISNSSTDLRRCPDTDAEEVNASSSACRGGAVCEEPFCADLCAHGPVSSTAGP